MVEDHTSGMSETACDGKSLRAGQEEGDRAKCRILRRAIGQAKANDSPIGNTVWGKGFLRPQLPQRILAQQPEWAVFSPPRQSSS